MPSATGPWAGQIAAMAGIDLDMAISKGAMVVTNVRQIDTVIKLARKSWNVDEMARATSLSRGVVVLFL